MIRIEGTVHVDLCTFTIASPWILLRMWNVSDEIYGEENAHFVIKIQFLIKPKFVFSKVFLKI